MAGKKLRHPRRPARQERVFDCVLFSGDFVALANRLEAVFQRVDRFIVVESTGPGPASIRFNALHPDVVRFASKVRHVVLEMSPDTTASPADLLREAAARGLADEIGVRWIEHPAGDRHAVPAAPAAKVRTWPQARTKRAPPVVICPYLFDHEPEEVRRKFGLDSEAGSRIRFHFWKDEQRIGPERAYEHCWNQFPQDDVIIVHTDMAPVPGQPAHQWFDDLCRYRDELPWAGMIACNLVHPRATPHATYEVQCAGGTFAGQEVAHLHGPLAEGSGAGVDRSLLEQVRLVDWVTFAGVLIRRELIDACGPFDKRYAWAYYMDVDYCFEARLRGFALAQVPVLLQHEESRSTRIERHLHPELQDHLDANRGVFNAKWKPLLGAVVPASKFAQPNFPAVAQPALDREPAPPGIILLTMHRSGSSCLAGMLRGAGFFGGQVFEWNEDNRKGNQEDARVIELNESVLRKSGGSWMEPPGSLRWDPSDEKERDLLMQEFFQAPQPWMFKEPRTLLTLAFWTQAAPSAHRIGVFRHPLAVAESLAARNGLPLRRGLELWLAYNTLLVQEHARSAFPIACFDQPREAFVASIGQALQDLCPELVGQGRIDLSRLAPFYEGDLVHRKSQGNPSDALRDVPGVDAAFVQELTALYERLCGLAGIEAPATGSEAGSDSSDMLRIEQAAQQGLLAAYRACEELLRDQPQRTDLWSRLIALAKQIGDGDLVESAISAGVAVLPADPNLWMEQAHALLQRGSVAAGLRSAERAASLAPDWQAPRILLVAFYAAQSRWHKALHWMLAPGAGGLGDKRWGTVLMLIARDCLSDAPDDNAIGSAIAQWALPERQAALSLRHWALQAKQGRSCPPDITPHLQGLLRDPRPADAAPRLLRSLHAGMLLQ